MMPPLSPLFRTFVLTYSLAASSLAFAADPAPAGDNLLTNGNFEEGATGWPAAGNGIEYPQENGNTYLQLKSPEPGKQVQAHRKLDITGADKALTLTFRARWTEIVPGEQVWHVGSVVVHFKDEAGGLLKPDPKPKNFKGSSDDWKEFTMDLEVPANAASLEIMPVLFQVASGTLEIDDLVLSPTAK